jgi:LPXTG-motif cell wall-anchored protein
MKNRFFGSAIALIASANLMFLGGSIASATSTDYVPELVHTFNTDGGDVVHDINSLGDKIVFEVGSELWASDGTDAGTVELTFPTSLESVDIQHDQWAQYSAVIENELYFFGWNGSDAANQIYKTDGTSITQVTDGAGFENYWSLVALDGNLYGWVDNLENGFGNTDIVKITPAGVITVIDGGNDNWTSSAPTQIQMIGGALIYVNDPNESNDYGLYSYDPSRIVDIEELDGPASDLYETSDYIDDEDDRFYVFDGEMYYSADATGSGYELFATDGTADGTRFVSDITGDAGDSWPSGDQECSFIPQTLGDYFYFSASTTSGDRTLFRSDGTGAGTEEAVSTSVGAYPGCDTYGQPPVLNGKLIIDFYTSAEGYEMYATDGTEVGTTLLADINDGSNSSLCWGYCSAQVLFDEHVFFVANDDENAAENLEIWVTDGTSSGTVKASAFTGTGAVGDEDDAALIVAGDNLYFGVENYASNGGDDHMSLYKISASGLANTGADANGTLWAGFGLLVAGVAVVAVRRRLTT